MNKNNIRTAKAARKLPINPITNLTLNYVEKKILEAAKNGLYSVQICCDNMKAIQNIALYLHSPQLRYYVAVSRNNGGIPVLLVDWSPEKEPSFESFEDSHPYR